MRASSLYCLLALGAALGTSARKCETTGTVDPVSGEQILVVTSPDQLTTFDNCDTITGHILIARDYSGDFILNGVTEFKGNISTEAPENSPAQSLGRVEMLGLVHVDNIILYGLINDVYLPKLERSGDLVLAQASPSAEVDVGSLVEAENVRITGSWTGINVRSLETVNYDIQFCGAMGCEILSDAEFPFLEVDLPSLKKTDSLEFAGTIQRVSVPELEVVGFQEQIGLYVSQGLRINIEEGRGHDLDFDAPKLHTLNGSLEVYGGVSGLSLGALGETSISATLNARAPLDVYSTIRIASNFYIWGELHSIYLPNFEDLGTLDLSYEPAIECNTTLYKLWDLIPSYGGNGETRCIRPDGWVDGVDEEEQASGDEDEDSNDSPNTTNDGEVNEDDNDDDAAIDNDDTTNEQTTGSDDQTASDSRPAATATSDSGSAVSDIPGDNTGFRAAPRALIGVAVLVILAVM
ncbi:hypothetical protein BDV06DRAFT_224063 [Aspergillus oleicola]